jgi:hypothetical protein
MEVEFEVAGLFLEGTEKEILGIAQAFYDRGDNVSAGEVIVGLILRLEDQGRYEDALEVEELLYMVMLTEG